jgi:3-methyladenine DNA glycosylase AlkD
VRKSRRTAILATFPFIKRGDPGDTFALSELLMGDREDLIHKATGWMLREVGDRDEAALAAFLDQHGAVMPRTVLRYAIEHFPPETRRAYLGAGRPPKSKRRGA